MLKDNIKSIRKSKGLSQEELAIKLNVVRQTISKWEQGLSVPDSEILISISEVLETPVSTLLGENISESKVDDMKALSEKLEIINLQLSKRKESILKFWNWTFISICLITVMVFIGTAKMGNIYMELDYNKPEYAVLGVAINSFEWIFIRISPIILIVSIIGIILTRKKA
ncbi:MAG: helix-turn-helix domain-containing protein [Clostridia bacterium]|jgi:putative transcriptional regulator|nr:helix-turn-helix domain-containing protein [Clostridia bacterium]